MKATIPNVARGGIVARSFLLFYTPGDRSWRTSLDATGVEADNRRDDVLALGTCVLTDVSFERVEDWRKPQFPLTQLPAAFSAGQPFTENNAGLQLYVAVNAPDNNTCELVLIPLVRRTFRRVGFVSSRLLESAHV